MGKDLGQCLPSSFQNHDFLPNKMQAESNPFENRSLRFPESYGQKKRRENTGICGKNSAGCTLGQPAMYNKNMSIGSVKSTCLIILIIGSKSIMLKCCKAQDLFS